MTTEAILTKAELPVDVTSEQKQGLQRRLEAAVPQGLVVIPNIRFDFEGWTAYAVHVLCLKPDQAIEWVQSQFDELVATLDNLKPGDCIVSAFVSDDAGLGERHEL